MPQNFFVCTLPVIKEGVIPTTLSELFYMTIKLKDGVLIEKTAKVDWLIVKPN